MYHDSYPLPYNPPTSIKQTQSALGPGYGARLPVPVVLSLQWYCGCGMSCSTTVLLWYKGGGSVKVQLLVVGSLLVVVLVAYWQ